MKSFGRPSAKTRDRKSVDRRVSIPDVLPMCINSGSWLPRNSMRRRNGDYKWSSRRNLTVMSDTRFE